MQRLLLLASAKGNREELGGCRYQVVFWLGERQQTAFHSWASPAWVPWALLQSLLLPGVTPLCQAWGNFPPFPTPALFKANATKNGSHKWLAFNGYWCLKHPSWSLCSWKSCSYLRDGISFRAGTPCAVGPVCIVVSFYTALLVMEIITSTVMKGQPGLFLNQVFFVSPLSYNT